MSGGCDGLLEVRIRTMLICPWVIDAEAGDRKLSRIPSWTRLSSPGAELHGREARQGSCTRVLAVSQDLLWLLGMGLEDLENRRHGAR